MHAVCLGSAWLHPCIITVCAASHPETAPSSGIYHADAAASQSHLRDEIFDIASCRLELSSLVSVLAHYLELHSEVSRPHPTICPLWRKLLSPKTVNTEARFLWHYI